MELLSTAENMEDLLAIESKLSDIRYEIESYESQLRLRTIRLIIAQCMWRYLKSNV